MFVSARGRGGRLLEGCADAVNSANETGIFFFAFFFFRERQGNGEDFEGEMSERIKTNQGRTEEEERIEMKDEHHRLELFFFFFLGTTKKKEKKNSNKAVGSQLHWKMKKMRQ